MKFENGEYKIDYRKIVEFAPQIIKQRGGILADYLRKGHNLLDLIPCGELQIYKDKRFKINIISCYYLSKDEVFYNCREEGCGITEQMLEKILVKENNLEIE
jgi:hypothetical protein